MKKHRRNEIYIKWFIDCLNIKQININVDSFENEPSTLMKSRVESWHKKVQNSETVFDASAMSTRNHKILTTWQREMEIRSRMLKIFGLMWLCSGEGVNKPCSDLDLSADWQAVRHSWSSGDGISPADPPAVSCLACHQWWSSLLII